MLNKIIIMGRLVRDPEKRTTQSGVSVVSFTVAVDRDYKQGDEKIADFIDCTAWRGTSDFIARNFTKGRMICVDGSLNSRKWTDKEGNNRVSWEVQAQNVYFADSKRNDDGQQSKTQTFEEVASEDDGDLPF